MRRKGLDEIIGLTYLNLSTYVLRKRMRNHLELNRFYYHKKRLNLSMIETIKFDDYIDGLGFPEIFLITFDSFILNIFFLEINPIGQFGMTSIPCNYYLKKRNALKFIEIGKKFY